MRVCPECGNRTEASTCPVDGLITLDESLLETTNPLLGRCVAGKYEIIEEIGVGGMGSVHRARHVETGGFVAVKVMSPDRAHRPTAIKRFHLEAQNAAVLRHANTVRILDFGVDDDLLYLVMEYLEGAPLSAVIRREGALPWARAAHIAKQVLKALWEAHGHARRIVHRDIKPANIFLCEQVGDPDFVKVVDFGVARSMEGTGAGTKGAIGTPGAMAPEQWGGGGDARSDLYSVGCMLYEMIVGHPPFVPIAGAADKLMQLAHMHMNTLATPITYYAPNTPIGVVRLTHALLAKDPEDRPQSARETVELLDKALYGDTLDQYADYVPDVGRLGGNTRRRSEVSVATAPDGSEADPTAETAAFGTVFAPASINELHEMGTVAPDSVRQGSAAVSESEPGLEPGLEPGSEPGLEPELGTVDLRSSDPVVRTIALHEESAEAGETSEMADFLSARMESGARPPVRITGQDIPNLSADDAPHFDPAPPFDPAAPAASSTPAQTSAPVAAAAAPSNSEPSRSARPAPTRGARSTSPAHMSAEKSFPLGWVVIAALAVGAVGWFFWAKANHKLPPAITQLVATAEKSEPDVDVPGAPEPISAPTSSPDDEDRGPKPDAVYRARLGERDHKSKSGRGLKRAVDVLVRDRENFHIGVRDIDDGQDTIFHDENRRAALREMLKKALTRDKSIAIVRGRPLVEVQIWTDYVAVAILKP